ncbi:MAG: right-handed parallel beta-helix repeat-containing protein, partial [Ignavibacteriaceae bacterium]|nr:right-handed parallel beta-helix repeat-containing protein [Ignavibacteriaceae bacterium]
MNLKYLIIIIALGLFFQSTVYSQSDIPTLDSPSDKTIITSNSVTFSWESVDNASDYRIQISTDPDFNTVQYDHHTYGAISCTIPLVNGTYYWRVSSYNSDYDTWSDYSSSNSFTISVPPQITGYSSPTPAGFGAKVTISGSNFGSSQGSGSVTFFCGNPLITTPLTGVIISWSDNAIVCEGPMHASSGAVTVTNNQGRSNLSTGTPTFDITWGYLHTCPSAQVNYQITDLGNYKGSKSATDLTAAIVAASTTWESNNTHALFNIGNSTNNPMGYICFGTPSGGNAETTTDYTGYQISSIETVIDQSANFDSQYDLQSVMTHEFGHWVGLDDLYGSDDATKVMYGKYTGLESLTSSETSGAQAIYGVGVVTGIGGSSPTPFPTPVSNVQATISGQNVTLTWNKNISYEPTIEIFKNNFNTPIFTTQISTTTSYTDPNGAASLPVTYLIGITNSAGTAYSQPITISSSTINSNTNWQGIVYTNGSVTVNSGYNLTIRPGTTIYFPSGASLTVNGSLTANGNSTSPISFTSNSSTSPGSWGSIILSGSGANGSTLQYANVQYGTEIDVLNANNVTVQNCAITNSSMHGIKFYGSTGSQVLNNTISNTNTAHGIYIQDGSNVNCTGNTIKKTNQNKSGVGIYFGGGGIGIATQNDISGFSWGIGAIWGSSPTSQHASGVSRNNRITNCYIGIDVYYNSYPVFGIPSATDIYGINSIYNNTTNINVGNSYPTYSSSLYACQNWWGSNPPNTSLFNVNANSHFYYLGYASSDPWVNIPLPSISQDPVEIASSNSNISMSVTSSNNSGKQTANIQSLNDWNNASIISDNNTNLLDSLITGINLRDTRRNGDAKNFFVSYLKKHPDNQAAYVYLYSSADSNTTPEIINFFKSLPEQASNDQKLLLSYLYLRENKIELAKSVNNDIILKNPNTPLSVKAMLNNYYIALYNENNLDEASTILAKIENQSDLSIPMEISSARDALTTYKNVFVKPVKDVDVQNKINSDEGNTPQTFSLNQNYPNPFNPSTIIEYQLPNNSMVTLKVYDILGREI